MASFSAFLEVEGKKYIVALCSYSFRQHTYHRGRPRSKVRKGPIYVELYADEDTENLVAWSLSDLKTLSGKIVFSKPDTEATLKHLWFTHAYCSGHRVEFDSTGTTGGASLIISFTISPEDMGVDSGNGDSWIAPPPRAYAYIPVVAAPAVPSILIAPPVVSAAVLAGPKPPKNTPEGIAWRWAAYLKGKTNPWPYQRWIKQTLTNHQNCEVGLSREAEYQAAMGGVSKTLKTGYTNRQVDIYIEDEEYCGQLKTGKLSLGKQQLTDLKRDEWLIQQQMTVEYILEKGGSKPLLKALTKIGPQIP